MDKEGQGRTAEKVVLGAGVAGVLLWWLLRPKAEAQAPGVDADLLDFGMIPAMGAVDDVVTVNVYWQNTGLVDTFFDILIIIDTWEILFRTDVVPAGQTITSSRDVVVPSMPVGIYDATVKISSGGYLYDELFLVNSFQVIGAIGEQADIEGFFISGG